MELGSLITVISPSRSAAEVREPYYQDLVSLLLTLNSLMLLASPSMKTSCSYNVYRKQAAKLDPQITQVSLGEHFPFYFHPLSIDMEELSNNRLKQSGV